VKHLPFTLSSLCRPIFPSHYHWRLQSEWSPI